MGLTRSLTRSLVRSVKRSLTHPEGAVVVAPPAGTTGQPIGLLLILTKAA